MKKKDIFIDALILSTHVFVGLRNYVFYLKNGYVRPIFAVEMWLGCIISFIGFILMAQLTRKACELKNEKYSCPKCGTKIQIE